METLEKILNRRELRKTTHIRPLKLINKKQVLNFIKKDKHYQEYLWNKIKYYGKYDEWCYEDLHKVFLLEWKIPDFIRCRYSWKIKKNTKLKNLRFDKRKIKNTKIKENLFDFFKGDKYDEFGGTEIIDKMKNYFIMDENYWNKTEIFGDYFGYPINNKNKYKQQLIYVYKIDNEHMNIYLNLEYDRDNPLYFNDFGLDLHEWKYKDLPYKITLKFKIGKIIKE